MKRKVVNDEYARLEGPAREARSTYFSAWLRWGFSILLLHKATKEGECCCSPFSPSRKKDRSAYEKALSEGRLPPCSNPGKHQIDIAPRCVASSIEEIEAHLDDGGSVGLVLRVEGVPLPPVPLVVFDCDKATAEEWLRARLDLSPLASRGRVGMHDYRVIPGAVPTLRSDTSSLNPGRHHPGTEEKPGIDVKVSGIVVMAFSRNKSLYWNGEDISSDPNAVAAVFGGSLGDFLGMLPKTDPRTVAPRMREVPPVTSMAQVTQVAPGNANRARNGGGAAGLSATREMKEQVIGTLHMVAYHHRHDLAKDFIRKAKPAIQGADPDGTMFRVLATLLKHYFLSERDTFDLVQKWFNPRCLDDQGAPYPYGTNNLVRMIRDAQRMAYNPIGGNTAPDFHLNIEEMHANHRRRDARSNGKRQQKRAEERALKASYIRDFIETCCTRCPPDRASVVLRDLYDACIKWVERRYGVRVSDVRIKEVLEDLGIQHRRTGHKNVTCCLGIQLAMRSAA